MPANFLDWPFWRAVDNSIPSPANGRAKQRQGERWHLYQLHSVAFADLIDVLAAECATRENAHVTVNASSSWIDAHPHAHWQPAKSKKWKSVELADLLVVITQNQPGQTAATTRAMLLQGKWTDHADKLGTGTLPIGKKSSSIKERDLLELATSPIELHETRKKTVANAILGGGTNKFHLTVKGKSIVGMNYARYLLFPNKPFQHIAPFQTLVPTMRQSTTGATEHYEDLLIEMASPKSSIPDLASCPGDWANLASALTGWTSTRSVSRFHTTYSSREDHAVTGLAFLAQHNAAFRRFLNAGGLNASYAAMVHGAFPPFYPLGLDLREYLPWQIHLDPKRAAVYAKHNPDVVDYVADEISAAAKQHMAGYHTPRYPRMPRIISGASAKGNGKKFLVVQIAVTYGDRIVSSEERKE